MAVAAVGVEPVGLFQLISTVYLDISGSILGDTRVGIPTRANPILYNIQIYKINTNNILTPSNNYIYTQVSTILYSQTNDEKKPEMSAILSRLNTQEAKKQFILSKILGRSFLFILEHNSYKYSPPYNTIPIALTMLSVNDGKKSKILEVYDWSSFKGYAPAKGTGKILINFVIRNDPDYLIWFGQMDKSDGLTRVYKSLKDVNDEPLYSFLEDCIQSPLGITVSSGDPANPYIPFRSWFARNNNNPARDIAGGYIIKDEDILEFYTPSYFPKYNLHIDDDFSNYYLKDIIGDCTTTHGYITHENSYILINNIIGTRINTSRYKDVIYTNDSNGYDIDLDVVSSSRLISVYRPSRLHSAIILDNIISGHSHPLGIYLQEKCGLGWPSIQDLLVSYGTGFPYHFVITVEGMYLIKANIYIPERYRSIITQRLSTILINFDMIFPGMNAYFQAAFPEHIYSTITRAPTKPFSHIDLYRNLSILFRAGVLPREYVDGESLYTLLVENRGIEGGIRIDPMLEYIQKYIDFINSITLGNCLTPGERGAPEHAAFIHMHLFQIEFTHWRFSYTETGHTIDGLDCKAKPGIPPPEECSVTLTNPHAFSIITNNPRNLINITAGKVFEQFNTWRTGSVQPARANVNITPPLYNSITKTNMPQITYIPPARAGNLGTYAPIVSAANMTAMETWMRSQRNISRGGTRRKHNYKKRLSKYRVKRTVKRTK